MRQKFCLVLLKEAQVSDDNLKLSGAGELNVQPVRVGDKLARVSGGVWRGGIRPDEPAQHEVCLGAL